MLCIMCAVSRFSCYLESYPGPYHHLLCCHYTSLIHHMVVITSVKNCINKEYLKWQGT
jgi:hypothetical protein